MSKSPSDGYTKRFYLRPEDREQIVRLARQLNISQSQLVRDAVDAYEEEVQQRSVIRNNVCRKRSLPEPVS
jgi:hypothetical protein